MIASISGTVLTVGPTSAVIEVGGIGLLALVTPNTATKLTPGESGRLATSLVVREDSLTLYGFADTDERDCFELLLSASGVGPKLAQAALSVMSPPELQAAITRSDLLALTRVPGIGKKGAERIVIELRDKIGLVVFDGGADESPVVIGGAWREQVSAGLQGLGWSAKDAESACERVAHLVAEDPDVPVPILMRAALQALAR